MDQRVNLLGEANKGGDSLMRCPQCGREVLPNAQRCAFCGALLATGVTEHRAGGEAAPADVTERGGMMLLSLSPSADLPAADTPGSPFSAGQPDVVGTVISAEAPYYERPDIHWQTAAHRVLLITELVGIPILLLRFWLAYASAISLIAGFVVLFLLFRYLVPVNILSILGILRLLNPRGDQTRQVPVRYFRIRCRDGAEQIVRAKGRLRGANLMPGDDVALWGVMRRGTLHLRRAFNLRTGAYSQLRNGHSWLPLVLNLAIVAVLFGLFYGPVARVFSGGRS